MVKSSQAWIGGRSAAFGDGPAQETATTRSAAASWVAAFTSRVSLITARSNHRSPIRVLGSEVGAASDRLTQALEVGHLVVDLRREAHAQAPVDGLDVELERVLEEQGVLEPGGVVDRRSETRGHRHGRHRA